MEHGIYLFLFSKTAAFCSIPCAWTILNERNGEKMYIVLSHVLAYILIFQIVQWSWSSSSLHVSLFCSYETQSNDNAFIRSISEITRKSAPYIEYTYIYRTTACNTHYIKWHRLYNKLCCMIALEKRISTW